MVFGGKPSAGWDSMKRIGTRKERDALIIRRMFS